MTWSRSQYEDRIRARMGDLGILQHIAETQIPLALERAIATFTKDRPAIATNSFSGDGSIQLFDLTVGGANDTWLPGWSRIVSIEHPTGNIPRTFVDSHDYEVDYEEDDLIFFAAPTIGTDNIKVKYTGAWGFPDDDPSDDTAPIPEVYAQAIADLAAATIARAKATEFARQQSTSVAGDLFQRDAEPLFSAASAWEKAYKDTVLGRPTDEETKSQVYMTTADVDVFPASLFHRRAEYISEEALGG